MSTVQSTAEKQSSKGSYHKYMNSHTVVQSNSTSDWIEGVAIVQ